MSMCEHGTEAILQSDVEHLIEYGINPDCIYCPHDFGSCRLCRDL
jgi:hypothetical protein